MDAIDAIRQRSSARAYTRTPLTSDEVNALIEAGLAAPTAMNRREIHFSVLRGDNPLLGEIDAETARLRGASPAGNFYYNAPLVIILSGDSGFRWSTLDAGIAVENIAVAAEGLGLGSVILGCIYDTLRGEKSGYFSKALGFPNGYAFEIAVAVGHKAAGKEPHTYDLPSAVNFLD